MVLFLRKIFSSSKSSRTSETPTDNARLLTASPVVNPPARSNAVIVDQTKNDPLGLYLLYAPDHDHRADVVFIHGLGGSSRSTWCKHKRLDLFWPLEWLPKDGDLEHARILTFGYNSKFRSSTQSSGIGIADFSKNLLFDMLFGRDADGRALDMGKVPTIFVAHSMGGLVFKRAFLDAQLDSRYSALVSSIRAVLFLSTPHRGSDLAPFLNRVLSLGVGTTSKQYVAELTAQAPFLRTVNEQFRHVANNLQIFSFYETEKSSIGMSSTLIVDPESAKLGYPGEVSRPLNADHFNVCKFESPQDPDFKAISGALKSVLSSSNTVTKPTSEELKQIRMFLSVQGSAEHDLDLFCSRRAESTCQWVLKEPTASFWLSCTSTSGLLRLHGRPGRGKSVIAAFLAQHLQQQGAYVQYFFFRAGDESKRSMAALVKSIAFQISEELPAFARRCLKWPELATS